MGTTHRPTDGFLSSELPFNKSEPEKHSIFLASRSGCTDTKRMKLHADTQMIDEGC